MNLIMNFWALVTFLLRPNAETAQVRKLWKNWVTGLAKSDLAAIPVVRTLGDVLDLLRPRDEKMPVVSDSFKQYALYVLLAPSARWYNPFSWGWILKPVYWPYRLDPTQRPNDVLAVLGNLSPELTQYAAEMVLAFTKSIRQRPYCPKLKRFYNQCLLVLLERLPFEQDLIEQVYYAYEFFGRSFCGRRLNYTNLKPLYDLLTNVNIDQRIKALAHQDICRAALSQEEGYLPQRDKDPSIVACYAQVFHRILEWPTTPYDNQLLIEQILFFLNNPDEKFGLFDLEDLPRILLVVNGENKRAIIYRLASFLVLDNGELLISSDEVAQAIEALAKELAFDSYLAGELEQALQIWESLGLIESLCYDQESTLRQEMTAVIIEPEEVVVPSAIDTTTTVVETAQAGGEPTA
ncbi:MAG: hypothetical protein WC508_03765 [Patescibacteria group bacterium]